MSQEAAMAPRADKIPTAGWVEPARREAGGELETLSFLEEELVPRTNAVSRGEVIVRKHVVTEMRAVQVPVRREVVEVYRRGPDGDPVEPSEQTVAPSKLPSEPTSAEAGGVIWDSEPEEEIDRLPLLEEEPVITTRLVVREEVVVRRLRYRGHRRIAEEVRREEPRLETQGPVSGSSAELDQFKED